LGAINLVDPWVDPLSTTVDPAGADIWTAAGMTIAEDLHQTLRDQQDRPSEGADPDHVTAAAVFAEIMTPLRETQVHTSE